MDEEISVIFRAQSKTELEQLSDDISFYLREHPTRIDQEFMSSILFLIPQYIERLNGTLTSGMPLPVAKRAKIVPLTPEQHPSKAITSSDTAIHRQPSSSSVVNDLGLTPGEQRLWDEQARLRLEEGETLIIPPSDLPHLTDPRQCRKPKYYNRVQSGCLWTDYNRLHYTEENPPPLQVLGYKFNIFYPDLVDHLKTPSYRLEQGKSGPNTLTLVFTAGLPYEQIEFQIFNKEWETSHRLGFKCVFERGSLQLYFNLKRDAIRR
jgi:Cactus-binding C-terminus of cactin protein